MCSGYRVLHSHALYKEIHEVFYHFIVNIRLYYYRARLFGEYSNIRLFDYDFEYSKNRFKGNM